MIIPANGTMTSRQAYLDSHPSLAASMEDYEHREFSPTVPDLPSQHSGFRSNASDYSDHSSPKRSYSPPAWRKAGSGWFKHPQESLSPHRRGGYASREISPQYYHDAEEDRDGNGDVTAYRIATGVPLPGSPTKGRSPSCSPQPDFDGVMDRAGGVSGRDEEVGEVDEAADTPTQSNCKYSHVVILYAT